MKNTSKRIKNPETLQKIGSFLRVQREAKGLTQAAVGRRMGGLRQATISSVEQGGGATADTLISFAAALGLELVFTPIGQGGAITAAASASPAQVKRNAQATAPGDLLEEFDDLQDDAP